MNLVPPPFPCQKRSFFTLCLLCSALVSASKTGPACVCGLCPFLLPPAVPSPLPYLPSFFSPLSRSLVLVYPYSASACESKRELWRWTSADGAWAHGCRLGVTWVHRCRLGVTWVHGCGLGVTWVPRCRMGVTWASTGVVGTQYRYSGVPGAVLSPPCPRPGAVLP